MFCKPEDNLDVCPVPAVSDVVGEEAPRVVVVLVWKEDAYTVRAFGRRVVVVAPDDAEIQRASRGHYSDVWKGPAAVIVGQ